MPFEHFIYLRSLADARRLQFLILCEDIIVLKPIEGGFNPMLTRKQRVLSWFGIDRDNFDVLVRVTIPENQTHLLKRLCRQQGAYHDTCGPDLHVLVY